MLNIKEHVCETTNTNKLYFIFSSYLETLCLETIFKHICVVFRKQFLNKSFDVFLF